MAVPKYRTSRSKARSRRAHQRLAKITVADCPRCHEPKLPHRACPSCGHYNGMKVIDLEEAEE